MPRRTDAAEREQRRRQVAQLTIAGVPQTQIAEQLGVTQPTVSNDLRAIRGRWQQDLARDTLEHVADELGKLAEWERQLMRIALAVGPENAAAREDPEERRRAWDTLLKLQARRSRLIGLDAPYRVQADVNVTVDVQATVLVGVLQDALADLGVQADEAQVRQIVDQRLQAVGNGDGQ